jgi:leucyl-tRNA synthetase
VEEEIKKIALEDENVKKHVTDLKIKKIIYVPRKLINIVV